MTDRELPSDVLASMSPEALRDWGLPRSVPIVERGLRSSLTYLADTLANAIASGDSHKLLVTATGVEIALRMRAKEMEGG
jgi:hypothetical protein